MIKPFKNAYDAIKKLLAGIFGKKPDEPEQTEAENQESVEEEKARLEQMLKEMEAKKAEEERLLKEKQEQAKREEAQKAAQQASGAAKAENKQEGKPEGGGNKKNRKKGSKKTTAPGSGVSQSDIEEQKKYEEEVKKRAERAAKREREERKAAAREREAEGASGVATAIDPVTGDTVELGTLPPEAVYLKKYLKLSTTGDDVLLAINSIIRHPDMSKNIVVLGKNGFGTVKVGEDFARSFFATGIVKSDKIAKIKAKQLNKISLEKLKDLKGGCLIIENAGLVTSEKLVDVIKNASPEENDYVVILTGEIDSLASFFEDHSDIVDSFIYLIDIHKIKERGMITLAKGYVKEKGYTADKPVYDRLKNSLQSMETGNIDRFIEIIDKLIEACDSREKVAGIEKKEILTDDFS